MTQVTNKQDENSYSALIKATGKVTCDFCEKSFNNRYNNIIHNAYHIVIPLIKQEVHACPECLFYFTSNNDLNRHLQSNHIPTLNTDMEIKTEPEDDYKDIILYDYDMNTDCKQSSEEYILPDACASKISPDETDNMVAVAENVSKSEHYDDLMVPGMFKCRHCGMQFPNRLKLIEHGIVHIRFKKGRPLLCTICDMYIAGNHYQLSKHVAEKHPQRTNRPRSKTQCTMCGLKYHKYARHLVNYHSTVLQTNDSISQIAGDKSCSGEKLESAGLCGDASNVNGDLSKASIFNVCQVCLPFLKKKINLKYSVVGTVNEMGVRHKCSKCHKLFFEITLVKRIARPVDRMHFDEDTPKKKTVTNRDRLRNIQMRLKMINKLSKFYLFWFYFSSAHTKYALCPLSLYLT